MHHVEVGEVGEKVCPNCRMPLPENARFCAECGSRIDITVTRPQEIPATIVLIGTPAAIRDRVDALSADVPLQAHRPAL